MLLIGRPADGKSRLGATVEPNPVEARFAVKQRGFHAQNIRRHARALCRHVRVQDSHVRS
jgi:pyridoxine 5'-phosphate synthase PdxJ